MIRPTKELILPAATPPCACTSLRKAARAVSRYYEGELEGSNLTITQFSVLRALDREPEQPLSRLAEAMVMDRTSLYRTLAPMIGQGWIAIEPGPGRAKIARLTDRGGRMMAQALPLWTRSQARFLAQFGREDFAALTALLERAAEVAEEAGRR